MDNFSEIKLELVAQRLISGKPVKVRAGGHSMNPFIKKGDFLTLQGVPNHRLQPGDIAAFIRNGFLFIHRIIDVGRADGMILTKGDNLSISDKLSGPEEILGVVLTINETIVTSRSQIHRLFFYLYRFCLMAGNDSNTFENHRLIRLSSGPFRFWMSTVILRTYRFFVFL